MRIGLGGITGTGILPVGRGVSVGGGGGEVIRPTFWLRDDFLTDEAAPLASPRTAEPGPGTLNVNDPGSKFSISNGQFVVSNTGGGGTNQQDMRQVGIVGRKNGRTVLGRITPLAARHRQGFVTSNSTAVLDLNFFNGKLRAEALGDIGDEYSEGESYEWAIALSGTHSLRLIRGGLFTDWTLLFIMPVPERDDWQAYISPTDATTEAAHDFFRVADLLGPWLDDYGIATDRLAGSVSAGDTFTHEADCVIEWTQTTLPSSGYTDVWLRRIDADNGIVVSTASDGTVELYAVESGNWSQLGFTSAGTAANGHRFVVVCDGTTIRVYSNNTLQITGASSVGQNATAGELDALGTGGAVSNLVSWPRVISGIAKQWLDAAIAD